MNTSITSLAETAVVLLMVALSPAGCTTSGSKLSVESAHVQGEQKQIFSVTEAPAIYVDSGQRYYAALKVRRSFDGATMWRMALADFYWTASDAEPVSGFDDSSRNSFDPIFSQESDRRIPLPRLPSGNYVVELWIKGKRVTTADYTVTATAVAEARPATAPRPSVRSFGLVNPAVVERRDVAALDAVVGLTTEQQRAAKKILIDEFLKLGRAAISRGEISQGGASAVAMKPSLGEYDVRVSADAAIRALLTPAQLKLYADDGAAYQWQLYSMNGAAQKVD